MARLARVVIPGLPHHVTQRGNHREAVFFGDDDYRAYLDLGVTVTLYEIGQRGSHAETSPNPGSDRFHRVSP